MPKKTKWKSVIFKSLLPAFGVLLAELVKHFDNDEEEEERSSSDPFEVIAPDAWPDSGLGKKTK